jgi:hypothetical protein
VLVTQRKQKGLQMLTALQKDLLARAAKRKINEMGSINAIFYIALDMRDIDTCDYIVQHYLTAQHFTQDELQLINANWKAERTLMLTETALDEAQTASIH